MAKGTSEKGVLRGRLELASCLEEVERAQHELVEAMASRGHEAGARFAVRAAVEEALANAIEHGNRLDTDRRVTVEYQVDESAATIEVADQGPGFDPGAVPDPTRPENIDIPSGRGITLMKAFMSEVEVVPPGNRVRLVYRRPGGGGPKGQAQNSLGP